MTDLNALADRSGGARSWPTTDNWDSYGAKATTTEAIASAESVTFVPTVIGGVLVEHDGFIVEIMPDGTISPEALIGGVDVSVDKSDECVHSDDDLNALADRVERFANEECHCNTCNDARAAARILRAAADAPGRLRDVIGEDYMDPDAVVDAIVAALF